MSYASIIDGLLRQGMASQSHQRLRTGAETADRSGGIEELLGSLLGGRTGTAGGTGGGGGGGFADMARDFLTKPQAGGMSGGKIGGLGAIAGAVLGRGVGGAAKGGAMAILGTLALNAWRDYQAQSSGAAGTGAPGEAGGQPTQSAQAPLPPTAEQVEALTDPRTERLMLRAMIGAAQVDGRITGPELEKILGQMGDTEVTEEERRAALQEVARPVAVEDIGREVSRPEVAMQIYLAALMAVDIDTEAERDYFRRLARALRLDPAAAQRLRRMTGAPAV